MKKLIGRILAIVLSLIMIVSCNTIAFVAKAARESITAAEVVNYMNALVGQQNQYQGYCLLFVSKCWEGMGFTGSYGWGNATNFANANRVSTSRDNIPIGADVFFTSPDGNGHIGIYVGDGYFVHAGSASTYQKSSLSESYYYNHYTGWGWHPYVKVITDTTPTGSEMSSGYDRVLPDGDYLIANAGSADKTKLYYLDIEGVAQPAVNGTNVSLCGPTNGDVPSYEIWTLTYSNGFYTIVQKGTTMALDVNNASKSQGGNVQIYISHGSSAQKWAISATGKGYRLQAKCSGMCLDVNGGGTVSGTNVQQYESNDSLAQTWMFIPYKPSQPISTGRYLIASALNENSILSVNSTSENANVFIHTKGSSYKGSVFDLIKLKNGYYKMINVDSGRALDVTNGLSNDGTNVAIHTDNGSIAQQWAIKASGNKYILISRCNGLVLDLAGAKTAENTNVQMYRNNYGTNQLWSFVPAIYKITYNANGGYFYTTGWRGKYPEIATETKTYGENYKIADYSDNLSTNHSYVLKKGYTFLGWGNSKETRVIRYSAGNIYKNNHDLMLYAVWKKNIYKISYSLNGGINNVNPATYTVEDETITLAAPTKKGYTFKGWYANSKFTGKAVTTIEKGTAKNITLYAKWSKNTYKITYKLNGGKNSTKNPKKYTVTSATIALKNPTRKGYKFKGWYSDSKYKKKVKKIAKGSTGNKTLYAKWAKK